MLSAAASECLESKSHNHYLLITDELTCTTIVLSEEARLLLPPLPAGRCVGVSLLDRSLTRLFTSITTTQMPFYARLMRITITVYI